VECSSLGRKTFDTIIYPEGIADSMFTLFAYSLAITTIQGKYRGELK
jgi:hypothetical protein